MKLYCVEVGIRQRKNLCRMLTSVVVMANTEDDAVKSAERRFPNLLRRGEVVRVFEVEHVVVDWPSGEVSIIERSHIASRNLAKISPFSILW